MHFAWLLCSGGFLVFLKKIYLCFLSGGEETPVTSPAGTPKKTKVEPYKLTSQQKSLIKSDEANEKLWNEVLEALKDGPVGTLGISPSCNCAVPRHKPLAELKNSLGPKMIYFSVNTPSRFNGTGFAY